MFLSNRSCISCPGGHSFIVFYPFKTILLKLRLLFFLLSGFASLTVSYAQSVAILIQDKQGLPLAGATVYLTSQSDSVRTSGISNQFGVAAFNGIQVGKYLVNVSYIGYRNLEEQLNMKEGENIIRLVLADDMIALGEVTVTASRPLIRQEDDKMIIDPEPMIGISTNTLEILESTPGLFVDQDGGIFLNTASPAAVYINGREQKMSSQDINTLLRSLPPNSVQQIEVIRTPSARYAASSSGGIINIVLKKGVKIGRFGSVSGGMNQGFYGNRFLGFTLNNSNDKTTSYVNLNYNNTHMLEELNSTRFLAQDTTLFQDARTQRQSHQLLLGYGLNSDVGNRLNLSYDGRINGSLPGSSSNNTNVLMDGNETIFGKTLNTIDNTSQFFLVQQDLGANFKLDTLGSEIDTQFSYSFICNNTAQAYQTSGMEPRNYLAGGEGDNKQQRHYLQFQSDLSYQMPFSVNLESGINSSYQHYQSDAQYQINLNGNTLNDPFRTNTFNYQENINAAYLQASRLLGWDVLLKTGLRIEHTYMKGNQIIPMDTSFVINRVDWFPYVYLSRPVIKVSDFELRSFLIYRKTITRPGYQSLNPSVNYIDQFLYEVGNPGLKPQFGDNIEINISFNEMPIFAVGRNYTRDIFSGVVYRDARDKRVAVRTFDNLGANKETYFRLLGAIPPGGTYFFALGTQYNLNEYEGFYENEPLVYSRGSWRFFTFHMLRLGKETRLTMSGFMMTSGQMNFYELKTFGQLNFGLNQTFFNKKLTLSLSARDVLRTMVNGFELNQGSITTSGQRYMDNQRFGINLRYTFGIPTKKEPDQNMFPFDQQNDF